jgi:hypothetical protein
MLYLEAFVKDTNALLTFFAVVVEECLHTRHGTESGAMTQLYSQPSYIALHESLDMLLNLSVSFMSMLQANTYMYWRRWSLEDSTEAQRAVFLYTATASRTLPSAARRIAQSASTAGPGLNPHERESGPVVSLGQALLEVGNHMESVYGKELSLESRSMRDVAKWDASFGTVASNIALPAVSLEYAKSVFVHNKRPTLNEFQRAEPPNRAALTVHALTAPMFVERYCVYRDAQLRSRNAELFSWIDAESVSTRFAKSSKRLSEVRHMRYFSEAILNRTPEYSVCDKHVRFFVYSSYEAFRRALEMSIDACHSDFNLA